MLDNLIAGKPLKECVQQILQCENLTLQRSLINTLAFELNIDSLDCASALLHILQSGKTIMQVEQKIIQPELSEISQSNIKMVRYRLALGSQQLLTLEALKQVLVEESGVDKNNISNVNIQELYTLIDLPDQMPLDIFQHLKSVEINQHKLDIRRVKSRNKKRSNNRNRRGQQATKSDNKIQSQVI
jgi:hypothetical protein